MFDRVSSAGHDEPQQRASFQFASYCRQRAQQSKENFFFEAYRLEVERNEEQAMEATAVFGTTRRLHKLRERTASRRTQKVRLTKLQKWYR